MLLPERLVPELTCSAVPVLPNIMSTGLTRICRTVARPADQCSSGLSLFTARDSEHLIFRDILYHVVIDQTFLLLERVHQAFVTDTVDHPRYTSRVFIYLIHRSFGKEFLPAFSISQIRPGPYFPGRSCCRPTV